MTFSETSILIFSTFIFKATVISPVICPTICRLFPLVLYIRNHHTKSLQGFKPGTQAASNYKLSRTFNTTLLLTDHTVVATCFNQIWSSSGQPNYKKVITLYMHKSSVKWTEILRIRFPVFSHILSCIYNNIKFS